MTLISLKNILFFALSVGASFFMNAAENNQSDSVRPPHQLRDLEVIGLKQMPSPGILPVTRLNVADIHRLGIENAKDVSDVVPNLFAPSYGSRMTSSIYMRGIGSRFDQAVVGLNVDGVSMLNKDVYDFDIPDISYFEVLRGAQSVLNGRNAMAGQINIYTLSPRDYQGFRFMAEYGRANDAKISAAGYFKIAPSLFTSLSAYYGHIDGFWKNEHNGRLTGMENNASVRWKTIWTPSAALSLTNTASFSINHQGGYPYAVFETDRINYNDTCFYRRNYFSDGLIVAWAGKRVVVTSQTSIQYLDDNLTLDQDFTPADYFTLTQARKELTVTEDLFTKGRRGKYSWMGGVTGFYRHSKMHAPVTFYDTGIKQLIENNRNEQNPQYPISWDNRIFPLDCHFTTPSEGFALYHQSTLEIGNWTLEAGLRWNFEHVVCRYANDAEASYTIWDKTPTNNQDIVYANNTISIHDTGKMSQVFNQLLPKIVVGYNFGKGEAYASASKSFKSGGFNNQMFSDVLQQRVMSTMGVTMQYNVDDIVSYKPETAWNYEIGARTNLLNSRLKAEAILFLINCYNQQLTMFPEGTITGRIMTNAGRTRSMGAELSAELRATDDWRFHATYGFTDARFRVYNNGREDFRNKRVPYTPTHTVFASALWRIPFHPNGLDFELNANVRGAGNIMWNEQNSLSQPFYALLGAALTIRRADWSVKLWGENLTNTKYRNFYFLSMGNSFAQRGNPITFGATFRIAINKNH